MIAAQWPVTSAACISPVSSNGVRITARWRRGASASSTASATVPPRKQTCCPARSAMRAMPAARGTRKPCPVTSTGGPKLAAKAVRLVSDGVAAATMSTRPAASARIAVGSSSKLTTVACAASPMMAAASARQMSRENADRPPLVSALEKSGAPTFTPQRRPCRCRIASSAVPACAAWTRPSSIAPASVSRRIVSRPIIRRRIVSRAAGRPRARCSPPPG